jgi:rsbT co-antagonist protein RsbR
MEIDPPRVERLKNAMALASAGAFDEAVQEISAPLPDQFGIFEEMLRVFFTELKETNDRIEQVIAEIEASREELSEKLRTIEAQREEIRVLGTPIVDAWDEILVVPLIGALNAERALEVSEKLLRRITEARARWVLVDLTGAGVVDAATADHLVRLAMAVRLLGSRCLLTGMRPGSAAALVELGVNLSELTSLPTVKEGLRYCITQDRASGRRRV